MIGVKRKAGIEWNGIFYGVLNGKKKHGSPIV